MGEKAGQIQLSENQGEVGVLFCDICDFDKILSSEAERIVILLDSFFRSFDVLCSANQCTKIETVGKTYVAASGLNLERKSNQSMDMNSKDNNANIPNNSENGTTSNPNNNNNNSSNTPSSNNGTNVLKNSNASLN